MLYEVVPTKQFRQGAGLLTYHSDLALQPGHLVEIPLGRSSTTGIIYRPVKSVDFPTKPITKILYPTPLPNHILKSIFWLSNYYLSPLTLCANLFLPTGITKKRRATSLSINHQTPASPSPSKPKKDVPLNQAQRTALQQIKAVKNPTKLLYGITGSGKTHIYLKLAQEQFVNHRSTILLVPEIALTSQLVQVFQNTFYNDVILIHSKQTEATRHQIWAQILNSPPSKPKIIIGPRSALLSPVSNLGLIIIDEAHEHTYFQENSPKYSALRLASFIAKQLDISCLLGSATPSVSDFYLAKQKNSLIILQDKAKETATPPKISLVDLRNRQYFSKNQYFSDQLLNSIQYNLQHHYQTLIFHNRRGSAPLTICNHCGWQALCPTCFLPLTLHTDSFHLLCHACGFRTKVPLACPECQNPSLIHKGFGTKLLENELKKLFKDAVIARFDADNTKNQTLGTLYHNVKSGDIDIIIGTQTITKGLDLPLLATVGVIQADTGLALPDFSAEEHTFSLLNQVIGRVGRGHLDQANVIIQTYQPHHPAIQHAYSNDYLGFAKYSLQKRKQSRIPPFYYFAKISVVYKTEKLALTKIQQLHQILTQNPHLLISAPYPAFHERTNKGYTWQIIIKSTARTRLLNALKQLPRSNSLHFSLDAPSLLI